MSYTQPTLGTVTLPHPSAARCEIAHRGGATEMASGAVAFDVVGAGKRTWVLSWTAISDTDKGTLATVYNAMATASATFQPPEGGSTATVTRTMRPPVFESVNAAVGIRWNVELEFREV
jgi:hypothetical protein